MKPYPATLLLLHRLLLLLLEPGSLCRCLQALLNLHQQQG
jgi:hypothetical protein